MSAERDSLIAQVDQLSEDRIVRNARIKELEERAAMWERLCDHFSEQLVQRWHDAPSESPGLAEFMGLTEDQYAAWVEGRRGDVLDANAKPDDKIEAAPWTS